MYENTYHITIGTYGTRLLGDEAPTVHFRNRLGDPFVAPNGKLLEEQRGRMREPACFFTAEQRLFVEDRIPEICIRGNWTYHLAGCQADHIHILLSADPEPKTVRRWLKTWLSQSLNEKYGSRTWLVRDGSTKWIKDERYFNNVYGYILKQRAHEEIKG